MGVVLQRYALADGVPGVGDMSAGWAVTVAAWGHAVSDDDDGGSGRQTFPLGPVVTERVIVRAISRCSPRVGSAVARLLSHSSFSNLDVGHECDRGTYSLATFGRVDSPQLVRGTGTGRPGRIHTGRFRLDGPLDARW